MTLEDIYFECEQKGITVDYFKTDKAKAFSFPYENGIVVLDKSKIETTAEETVLLAHEEVHIDLGAFYLFTTPLTVKGKMEQKVKKHTIKKLIPLDELKEAIHNGITEPWELAEYFNVDMNTLTDSKTSAELNSELQEYLEELKNRSEMRMLFSLAKGATKEDVEKAVRIIEALQKDE